MARSQDRASHDPGDHHRPRRLLTFGRLEMTLRELVHVLVRRWWLIVLVPVVMVPLLFVKARTQPFQSSLRASVLLPGDTETPGNSERPELMVMDDLPSLIG